VVYDIELDIPANVISPPPEPERILISIWFQEIVLTIEGLITCFKTYITSYIFGVA
jgi:hypothetical protein